MRLYYTITTIDPIIVSQTNTTTNNHECLDYIPGSAILGLLASNHYYIKDQKNRLTEEESWRAFHSGSCRFSPCYPVIDNQVSLPTPASWHFAKGEDAVKFNQYDSEVISVHSAHDFSREENIQYKQCRGGYVSNTRHASIVKQEVITKTAIERATGIAKEAQLYSYTSINAQQTFAGWIESDDEELLEQFKTSLSQNHRIGRSRNSEFGRVQLNEFEVEEPESDKVNLINSKDSALNSIVLWCLSDCELLNENGMPVLSPTGKNIHPLLENYSLNKQKSFIRTNRVSRFNQKRQGLDSEQCLIAKGSVLVFDINNLPSNTPAPEIQEILKKIVNKGLGINKQQGLGWVSVNPQWAVNDKLLKNELFDAIKIPTEEAIVVLEQPDTPLIKWVKEQSQLQKANNKAHQIVNNLLQKIVNYYKNSRRYNNIINSNEAGPSITQWRLIADKVRQSNTNWCEGVFERQGNTVDKHAICKASNDQLGWGIMWQANNNTPINFADKTAELLKHQGVETMRLLLEKLCRYDLSTFKGIKDFEKHYPQLNKAVETNKVGGN